MIVYFQNNCIQCYYVYKSTKSKSIAVGSFLDLTYYKFLNVSCNNRLKRPMALQKLLFFIETRQESLIEIIINLCRFSTKYLDLDIFVIFCYLNRLFNAYWYIIYIKRESITS